MTTGMIEMQLLCVVSLASQEQVSISFHFVNCWHKNVLSRCSVHLALALITQPNSHKVAIQGWLILKLATVLTSSPHPVSLFKHHQNKHHNNTLVCLRYTNCIWQMIIIQPKNIYTSHSNRCCCRDKNTSLWNRDWKNLLWWSELYWEWKQHHRMQAPWTGKTQLWTFGRCCSALQMYV